MAKCLYCTQEVEQFYYFLHLPGRYCGRCHDEVQSQQAFLERFKDEVVNTMLEAVSLEYFTGGNKC